MTYHVTLTNGQQVIVNNPVQFPAFSLIKEVTEPFMKAEITMPADNLNAVLKLAEQHKGTLIDLANSGDLIVASLKIPLSEIAYHFFSELKSVSHVFAPQMHPQESLSAGDVGYVVTGIKDPRKVRVGDTLTSVATPTQRPLAGYQPAKSMVFAGLYPKNNDYPARKEAVQKLNLNDPSFTYVEERSEEHGVGFHCLSLRACPLMIIRDRLHDEYGVDVLTTAPNVTYHVTLTNAIGVF
ncbi:hypothetical protein WP50_01165, partial [Lactiplantibacillus plantarum]